MTREEKQKAIDALKISAPVMAVTQEEFKDYIQSLNKIMDWLEQEPTTKNDLGVDAVSRADARSLICNIDIKHHLFGMSRKAFKDLYNGMDELPPVMPKMKPRKGHWIVQPSNKEQGERDFIWWKCSECGQVIFSETEHDRLEFHAFCGRCGAEMVEPQESEVEDGNGVSEVRI